jgi:hypothetical protein
MFLYGIVPLIYISVGNNTITCGVFGIKCGLRFEKDWVFAWRKRSVFSVSVYDVVALQIYPKTDPDCVFCECVVQYLRQNGDTFLLFLQETETRPIRSQ